MASPSQRYHHQQYPSSSSSQPPPLPSHHQQQQYSAPNQYQAATPRTQEPYQYQPQTPPAAQSQQPGPSATARPSTAHQSHRSRTFSFHSHQSQESGGQAHHRPDLHETSAEKEARRLHSKADPTLAISEAEPAVVAATMTETAILPLRSMQHRDSSGNVIADPDKSNPTRNRWERPLDTVRSFEAAIDGGYSRRSLYRSGTDSVANWNRRASFQPGTGGQPRVRQDSYYGRPVSFRPETTQFDLGDQAPPPRHSYFDGHGGSSYDGYNGGGGYGQPRHRMSRTQTEPQYGVYGRQSQVYPPAHRDRSYETVTSAAVSGSSDQAGYHTDPTSSDNSSIDRRSPAKRPEPVNDHGIGFSQSQSYQVPNFTVGLPANSPSGHPLPNAPGAPGTPGTPGSMQNAIPRKEAPTLLKRQPTQQSAAAPDKRKSWFARRFSKAS